MPVSGFLRIGGTAVVTAVASLNGPITIPSASADPCPNVQVFFARGTN